MLLKQQPKARNHLKRVAKAQWTLDDADDLEKCWLLLATTYMTVKLFAMVYENSCFIKNYNFFQAGKFDQALELCKKCIEYNKVDQK